MPRSVSAAISSSENQASGWWLGSGSGGFGGAGRARSTGAVGSAAVWSTGGLAGMGGSRSVIASRGGKRAGVGIGPEGGGGRGFGGRVMFVRVGAGAGGAP